VNASAQPVASLPDHRLAKKVAELPFTDLGNAKRLVKVHGQDLRYSPFGWLVWDGRRWRSDGDGAVMRRMHDTVASMRTEAANLGAKGDELWKHANKSESDQRLSAAVRQAQHLEAVLIPAVELDAHPYRLTALNGTVDLTTGELQAHSRGDLLTKLAPVEYDAGAVDPRWERFIGQTTGGDAELAGFLQRAAGYSLTGDTGEEVLFLAHGPAATGKSTLLETLKATLGEMAVTADFETFLKRRDGGGPRNGIAQLAGARFVASIEVDEGRELAEALVKTITGGDTVRGSFMYRDSFEFVPAFKLWLAANHAPAVSDDDDAIWRRIVRVPFDNQVPPGERDRTLKAHLRQPNAAVLAWMVEGCLAWQERGLDVPESVTAATETYRDAMDPLAEFLDQRCTLDPRASVPKAALHAAYEAWAREQGVEPVSRQVLGKRLARAGAETGRAYVNGKRVWIWRGLTLREATDA